VEKKFIKIGNSYGIIIPPTALSLLNINPDTDKVKISIENDKFVIMKLKNPKIQPLLI